MSVLVINYIIALILASFALFSRSKKTNRVVCFIIFIGVFILHAFVDINSLEDVSNYSIAFNSEIKKMSIWQCITTDVEICKMERGFALLLKIFSVLGLGFRAFLIFYAILFCSLFYSAIIKHSTSIILSTLLFLLICNNQSIYVIRQYIVVAVFVYSIRWIIERKLIKYLLVCIGCFFIHQSAVILIPIYFLYSLDLKKLLVIIAVLAIVLTSSIQLFIDYIGQYLIGYASYSMFEGSEGQNATAFFISVVYLLLLVFVLRSDFYKEGMNKLVFICAALNCLLLFWGIGFGFAARLSVYYGALNIFLVPIAIKNVKSPLIKAAIVIICLALNTYLAFNGSGFIEASNAKLMTL